MAGMETAETELVSPVSAPTRERIPAEAWRLMNRQGYRAVTMADLAGRLGMSKKTLYVHFADKEALALALVARTSERIGREVERAVERGGGDAELELIGALEAERLSLQDVFEGVSTIFLWGLSRRPPKAEADAS